MGTYRISQLADRAGVPATTLRYYEKAGLLPAARTTSGYRAYTDADADRLRFIGSAKHLGLPLDQIRDLLAVWDGGMCREIRDELRPMVAAQVAAADRRVEDLRAFRDRLEAALAHLRVLPAKDGPCDPTCAFLDDRPDRVPAPALHRRSGSPQPEIACSLDRQQYEDRIGRWRQLLGDAPRMPVEGGIAVRLPSGRAGALAELVVAEQECCPFFTFRIDFLGADIELTARAPETAASLVDALLGLS